VEELNLVASRRRTRFQRGPSPRRDHLPEERRATVSNRHGLFGPCTRFRSGVRPAKDASSPG
jgi:hypothetical protein